MPDRIITNIRGANACGKTTLARYFHDKEREFVLGTFAGVAVKATLKTVPGLQRDVLLLGTYDESKYSGCDKIKSKDAIQGALRYAAVCDDPPIHQSHIMFEGFYVSKSWGPYAELRSEILKSHATQDIKHRWLWAFLHAPEELIFARSEARRDPASRPIDKKELAGVVRQMGNSRRNAMYLYPAEEVLTLDPTRSPDELYSALLARMSDLEQAG